MNLENKDNSIPMQQTTESKLHRMLHIAAVLLLLSFLLFLCQLINFGVFNVGAGGPGNLPVSIRANSQADYSRDEQALPIPPVGANILGQIIMDMPATGDPNDRLATLEVVLSQTVPTMTPDHRFPTTPAPTRTPEPTSSRTPLPTISKARTPTPIFTPTRIFPSTNTPAPTRTFTPTRTTTKPPTPVPTFTFTFQPTATSSSTVTPTPTATSVLPTATFTPTPTSTTEEMTPTETQIPTPTFTETPTPTNAPVCMLTSSGIFLSGKNLETTITNNGDALTSITSININWPDAPNSQSISEIKLNGVTIVNADDPLPPSDYPSEKNWTGTQSDRELAVAESKLLILLFTEDLQSSGYSITITFDNGCMVSEGN